MPVTRNELKDYKSLLTRKGRQRAGRFSADGVRVLEEALRFDFLPERLLAASSELSPRGEALVDEFRRRGVEVSQVPARDLRTMADTATPQGVIGVFRRPSQALGELYRPRYRKVLWCERLADPGNLGTLVRSAVAFGFDLVVTGLETAEAYAPKVVRASAGSIFGIPVARSSAEEVLRFAEEEKFLLLASAVDGDADLRSQKKALAKRKLILAIGSEADGLPPAVVAAAAHVVRVHHRADVESLNAAIAGSILMEQLYE